MTGAGRIHALLLPDADWGTLRDRASTLEEIGAATVWVDDHLANPARPGQPWLDSWSVLSALAVTTRRIRIGPLVANALLRPAATLVRHALSVDHLSGGRLELGLGAGYAAIDRAVANPASTAPQFTETVSTVDAALRGRPVLDRFPALAPVSPRRVPLTVAAHDVQALGLCAAHGDRWVSYGGFGLDGRAHLGATRRRLALLDEACERARRPRTAIRRMLLAGSPAVTAEPLWSSVAAAQDFVGRYREAGIDEFTFYYPPAALWGSPQTDRVFEEFLGGAA